MQQEKNKIRQQELDKLEELIRSGQFEGAAETSPLTPLCIKYPFQYIQLLKKHTDLEVSAKNGLSGRLFVVAFRLVNDQWWKLQRYLAIPPKSMQEHQEFARSIEVMEGMIVVQTRDN